MYMWYSLLDTRSCGSQWIFVKIYVKINVWECKGHCQIVKSRSEQQNKVMQEWWRYVWWCLLKHSNHELYVCWLLHYSHGIWALQKCKGEGLVFLACMGYWKWVWLPGVDLGGDGYGGTSPSLSPANNNYCGCVHRIYMQLVCVTVMVCRKLSRSILFVWQLAWCSCSQKRANDDD